MPHMKAHIHVKDKKTEKELFWNLNALEMSTAKLLLNTVYFYNGKLFGLRGGEHRSLVNVTETIAKYCNVFYFRPSKSKHAIMLG